MSLWFWVLLALWEWIPKRSLRFREMRRYPIYCGKLHRRVINGQTERARVVPGDSSIETISIPLRITNLFRRSSSRSCCGESLSQCTPTTAGSISTSLSRSICALCSQNQHCLGLKVGTWSQGKGSESISCHWLGELAFLFTLHFHVGWPLVCYDRRWHIQFRY